VLGRVKGLGVLIVAAIEVRVAGAIELNARNVVVGDQLFHHFDKEVLCVGVSMDHPVVVGAAWNREPSGAGAVACDPIWMFVKDRSQGVAPKTAGPDADKTVLEPGNDGNSERLGFVDGFLENVAIAVLGVGADSGLSLEHGAFVERIALRPDQHVGRVEVRAGDRLHCLADAFARTEGIPGDPDATDFAAKKRCGENQTRNCGPYHSYSLRIRLNVLNWSFTENLQPAERIQRLLEERDKARVYRMSMEQFRRKALGSWATVGFLAVLCIVLAVLQFRWLGEIGEADKVRMRNALRESLELVGREFDRTLSDAASAFVPERDAFEEQTREEAYLGAYRTWAEQARESGIVKRLGIAVPGKDGIQFLLLDRKAMRFEASAWPVGWESMQAQITARTRGVGRPPDSSNDGTLIEFPRFRGGRPMRFPSPDEVPELEWLVIEYDAEFLLGTTLPRLLSSDAAFGFPLEWQVSRANREGSQREILRGDKAGPEEFDASTTLFDVRRQGPFPQRRSERGLRLPDGGRGRWLLRARPANGSVDSIVTQVRYRNLAISGAILLLMLATATLLVRSTRQQQKLAELQMNFVAGVSHELRTPLTVIRTAAFNLRGRVARNPEQVEKYGALIQEQSERLGAMVEEVLLFARSGAEKLVRQREPVAIESVIEQSIQSSRIASEGERLTVERSIPANLPLVMADESALTHAVQNLLDNAVKYGTEGSDWIGISAEATGDGSVEIRVADRGPGIPAHEAADIFDPFVRGKRAIDDQIHGTGLGLNIVRKIVEAHGGSVRVESKPMQRTEFIVKLPVAPEEHQDEFAHTAG